MKPLQKFVKNIKANASDYYTLAVLVVAIPFIVGMITSFKWGLLLSFVIQAVIGILYIKGDDK